MQQESDITVSAPFLTTTLSLNGDSSSAPVLCSRPKRQCNDKLAEHIAGPLLANASIKVSVSGAALAPGSLATSNGFFDSTTNTITFDRDTDPSLRTPAAGATGIGSFSFTTAPNAQRNPTITISITISGERVGESNVPTTVTASSVVLAKVASTVNFTATTLHASGPILNSGPIPPLVGKATTYTVQWTIANSGNDITGAQVSATLPSYVTFSNQESPAGSLIYDDTGSGTVTWRPGDIAFRRDGLGRLPALPSRPPPANRQRNRS